MRLYRLPIGIHTVAIGEHSFVAIEHEDGSSVIDVTRAHDDVLTQLRALARCELHSDDGILPADDDDEEQEAEPEADAPPPAVETETVAPLVDIDAPLELQPGPLTAPKKTAKKKA